LSTHGAHHRVGSVDHRSAARTARIERVLRSFRILTHDSLAELCDERSLGGRAAFDQALEDAVACGTVRRLGDELYETVEPAGAS
jgi:hypothetical protein